MPWRIFAGLLSSLSVGVRKAWMLACSHDCAEGRMLHRPRVGDVARGMFHSCGMMPLLGFRTGPCGHISTVYGPKQAVFGVQVVCGLIHWAALLLLAVALKHFPACHARISWSAHSLAMPLAGRGEGLGCLAIKPFCWCACSSEGAC